MSDIRCERCGGKLEGKNYFTFCSVKKQFVCLRCESLCKNYSEKILPNGTHCRVKYENESYKYLLLTKRIIVLEDDVNEAMPKYEAEKRTGILFDRFVTAAALYQNIPPDQKVRRARARTELAAMQRVLLRRIMSDPKTRQLYERLNGVVLSPQSACADSSP